MIFIDVNSLIPKNDAFKKVESSKILQKNIWVDFEILN